VLHKSNWEESRRKGEKQSRQERRGDMKTYVRCGKSLHREGREEVA
jgi:hypothetical protein